MEKGADEKKKEVGVCVTGASGYIASWLVKHLLLRGYRVHATLRNLYDPTKTEHLMRLEGAKERLDLFKADLMEEGSFDNAISGCQGVFHVASPVNMNVTDPQVEVLDPAVKGTLNVLRSCKRNPSVKRVILTSSMATVLFNGVPRSPEVVVDETWFSKLEYCDEYPYMKWYLISKVMAEEAAWKFCKENDIDMISMNPAMVIGPMLQPTLNGSVVPVFNLINGAQNYENSSFGWVNVKDVANAHILAFEIPSANGRYCLVERVAHFSEIVNLLNELYPKIALPEKCVDDQPFEPTFQVSKEKIKSLGINYIELKDSLKETVECLKEKGFINF